MTKSEQNSGIDLLRQIPPKSLIISRDGGVHVTRQAAVTDSETLFFTVPRSKMQQAVDSLHVSDSRGTTPRITFPANSFSPNQIRLSAEDAWNDLVHEQQGAFVQIQMGDNFAEGHLIGMRHHGTGRTFKSSLLLLNDSVVSAYNVESVTSVSFRNGPSSAALSKYTTSRQFHNNTKDDFCIKISTSGSGPGEVTVSYFQTAPAVPFSISYLARKPDGIPAYGIHPNLLLKCFATIPNPLPCNLEEVEVSLESPIYHNFPKKMMFSEEDDRGGDDSASQSGTDSDISASGHESFSSSQMLDIDNLFETSSPSSYASQASIEAFCNSDQEAVGKTILSLKEGECANVPLFAANCEGGLLHFYHEDYNSCTASLYIRNTSDRDLEPGIVMFQAGDFEPTNRFVATYIRKGDTGVSRLRSATGCRGRTTSESAIESVIKCSKVESKLLATVMLRRTVQYTLHNLEEQDIEVLVYHRTRKSSRNAFEIEAKWYENLNPIGDEEQGCKYIAVKPSGGGLRGANDFHVHIDSKQKCRLVVIERIKKVVEIPLLGGSVKVIAQLETNDMIGSKTSKGLYEIIQIQNEIELLWRRRRMLQKRFEELVENQNTMFVTDETKPEMTSSGNGQEKHDYEEAFASYTRLCSRLEGEMKVIQDMSMFTEQKLISLQHDLKSRKKILTEKESLN